jgi:ketosteroid isomerase-like protein
MKNVFIVSFLALTILNSLCAQTNQNEVSDFINQWSNAWETKDTNTIRELITKDYKFYGKNPKELDLYKRVRFLKQFFTFTYPLTLHFIDFKISVAEDGSDVLISIVGYKSDGKKKTARVITPINKKKSTENTNELQQANKRNTNNASFLGSRWTVILALTIGVILLFIAIVVIIWLFKRKKHYTK